MNRVVITGASGFVGTALTKALLNQPVQVYAVVRNREKLGCLAEVERLTVVEADLVDYCELSERIGAKIDCFYHLAWDGYGTHTNDPAVQCNNVRYALDALNAAVSLGAEKFIFTGSCHEFLRKVIPLGEEQALCSVYGAAKSAFKTMGRAVAVNQNITFCSTVFSHVFGVGDYNKRSANTIITKLLQGESPVLSKGDFLYDWTYIDDAVQGLIAVARAGKNLRDYYVGSRELRPFREIITDVRDAVAPQIALEFGGYIENTKVDYTQIDTGALKRDTGFEAQCDFAQSICKTVDWLKAKTN